MKKSQPDRPGNSAVSIGKHVRPRALRKAGVKKGAAVPSGNATRICEPVPATAAPDVTAYLQHEEIKPSEWQRIWDETAPQSRKREFYALVRAVGELPISALATSGLRVSHKPITTTNGVHGGAGTD